MKVSELIKELQKAKKEHGDLKVGLEVYDYYQGYLAHFSDFGICVSKYIISTHALQPEVTYGTEVLLISGSD